MVNIIGDANGIETKITFRETVPSTIYLKEGTVAELYPRNMVPHATVMDAMYVSYESDGKIEYNGKDYLRLYSGDMSYDVRIKFSQYNQFSDTVNELTKTIHVVSYNMPRSMRKKVLVIGDSYMDYPWLSSQISGDKEGYGVLSEIKKNAQADGVQFDFVGSHESYIEPEGCVIRTESYGGWNERNFVAEKVNPYEGKEIISPFFREGIGFNFAGYVGETGIHPDICVFFMGMNGGNMQGIIRMIDAIRSFDSSIKIVVCTIPPFFGCRDNTDYFHGEYYRNFQNETLLDTFKNREEENIFVCPVHSMFHRIEHYIHENKPYLQFGDDTLPVCTNHHPNVEGCKKLAYDMYNTLLYAAQ